MRKFSPVGVALTSGESSGNNLAKLFPAAKANDKGSIGIRLLTDLRTVFAGADRLPTAVALDRLCALDESPWADMDGKPLDSRGLAKRLREYVTADNQPIKARNIKTGAGVVKGYYATDLNDAWLRYCPPPPEKSATSATDPAEPLLTSVKAVPDT